MKLKSQERGQALILIAFAAVGLFAFAALAIDGSRVFSDRRHAQNAADTAVLAAALAKVRGQDYAAAGFARADSNGFNDTNSTVEIHQCSEAGLDPACEGLPADADPAEYIQVVIRLTTQTTFARIIGRTEVPSVVSAVARAGGTSQGPIGLGAAIAAMSPHDEHAITGNGNFTLDVNDSGLFSNSDHPTCSFSTSGSAGSYTVDTAFDVVGQYCASGSPTLSGTLNEGASQMPYPPNIKIPAPSITCTGNSVLSGNTFSPGFHGALQIPNGTWTFASGNHCFPEGLRVSGNTNIIVEDNSKFLITGGEFQSNANGTFTCTNLLVHINGGTGWHVNGNSDNDCSGITFYASTGNVTWNGNPEINFSAPTSGPYSGLLIYLPYGNSSALTINGNSGSSLTGSIIAVSSHIQVNGNSDTFAASSQIIGYTVGLSGNGNIIINYDPTKQYASSQPTVIQLTK
jgi:hypothetical protein